METRCLGVTGGLRVGDSFRVGNLLKKWSDEEGGLDILCSGYNADVMRFFRVGTDINIREIFVTSEGPIPQDWNAVIQYQERWKTILRADRVRFLGDLGESIPPGPYDGRVASVKLQPVPEGPFIVVQPDTISTWKKVASIKEVEYSLPVASVGLPGEDVVPGATWDLRGQPWPVVVGFLQQCAFWVGLDSALFNAAVFIKKRGLCVHFWDGLPGVSEWDLGVDLVAPSTSELKIAIDQMAEQFK